MSTIVEDGIFRLLGKVQNYDWGGCNFIPSLIGISPDPGVPYAEYWMGAHEKAPSQILQSDGSIIPLNDMLKRQPERLLGSYVAQVYGRLPFLFKVLDVREMLSIQVHPTKSDAEEGFVRENRMGIPLDSPDRNYKDDNHKPEIQVALSDFWLLQGFRPEKQLFDVLNHIPEFSVLKPIFEDSGYLGLYKYVMEMPQALVNATLNPLVERLLPKYRSGELEKASPDYWVARAVGGKRELLDRGIFSIYFFNLVKLRPGQASFQDAGIPHALLQGQCLEIMANSDNVIRGGLTPKHVDVPQLLKLVAFKELISEVSEGKPTDNPHEWVYESTSREFRLSKIQLGMGDRYQYKAYSAEIILLLSGEVMLESRNNKMLVKKGESMVLFAEERYQIEALSQDVLLFKASVPVS